MSEIILQAENLKKVFVSGKKEFTAVDDVSFELKRGECLGIVGESGFRKEHDRADDHASGTCHRGTDFS